ncbi:YcxB-like protein [Sinobaca qinghaiensis]|uniref:YcxB-like protein n=1 Tax=Sinobaca qinghaiensis TaxID=342944 RepID=A0A419UWV0_9BACL|nr:YcxB family protein [Sinobaca qinghaiensis]RKD69618.1 YcxB-like protein [Sinobaca qinghaiensis]
MRECVCQGRLTKKDFITFIFLNRRKELAIQFLLLWATVYFFLYVVNGYLSLEFETGLVLFFSVVIVGTVFSISMMALYFQAGKKYKGDAASEKLHTYSITTSKIIQYREGEHNEYSWEDVYKVVRTWDMFLLYISTNKAIILPFHFFESEKDIQEVKTMIDYHYKK